MNAAAVAGAMLAAGAVWALGAPSAAVARLRALTGAAPTGTAARRSFPSRVGATVLHRVRGATRQRLVWQAACIDICQTVAAELRAGRTPAEALRHACQTVDPSAAARLGPVLAAAQTGDDVADALVAVAHIPGARGLARLAACWRVGAEAGGAFADVIDRAAATLRDEHAHREEIAAQLAGPRATARLLAVLPVLGILLAAALGTHPLAFFLGTPYGLACFGLGLALDGTGLWWTHRLASSAGGSAGREAP